MITWEEVEVGLERECVQVNLEEMSEALVHPD